MKKIVIVIFDDFTDIDLFLMWDILGRNKTDWTVKIVGTKEQHRSTHGLWITTQGNISEANDADVVLFTSGIGVGAVMQNKQFFEAFSLNPNKQLIGSICAGSLLLVSLGILKKGPATTHPFRKAELQALGVETIDQPLVCNGNVATAGGCLSAQYLVGWVVERLYGIEKRKETLEKIAPVGESKLYEQLTTSNMQQAMDVTKKYVEFA